MKCIMIATSFMTLRAFLLPFARYFRDMGWHVDAMAHGVSTCPECMESFDHVWEVNWSRNPLDLGNLLKTPAMIRKLIAENEYDIVHVHTPVASFVTRFALKGLLKGKKPKIIYTAHGFHFYQGGAPFKNLAFLGLEKLAGKWTDYLVTINKQDESNAKKHNIVSPARVMYMPGIGIDADYYNSDMVTDDDLCRLRQELGIDDNIKLFAMIAEFIPRKRHRDLLHAFAKLKGKKTHLILAGNGPMQNEMKLLASELQIQDRTHFLGFRKDIQIIIKAAEATILTSCQEGLPRCIMESLCLEVPVIATDIRGSKELLEDNCGLLVKLADIDGIAQAMRWVLHNPLEAKAMGKRGINRMKSVYGITNILKLHEKLYNLAAGNNY